MNSKSLLLVLAACVVAVALFLLRDRGEGVSLPTDTSPMAEEPGAASPIAAAHRGAEADAAAVPRADPAGATERVEVDGAAGDEAAASPVTVRGRLVDVAGEPLAEVVVRLGIWRNPDRTEFFLRPGPDSPHREVTTGPDGAFRFALAADCSANLGLPDDDLVFDRDPAPVHGHEGDRDLGAITVRRSARVSGVVRNERGEPVPDVTVTAGAGKIGLGGISESTTRADGTFAVDKLRAGTWTLRTASASYLPTTHELTVDDGEQAEGLVLTVAQGRAIAGQVVDDLGRPVSGMKVGAKRSEASGGIDIERFSSDEAATSDANGLFSLSGLEGETATVRAFGPGHSAALATDVPVGTGNLVLRVERLGVVAGVLVARDGAPLAGSRVRAVPAGDDDLVADGIEGVLLDRGASATTSKDGTFRIEGVKPGRVTVTAEGDGHRPATLGDVMVRPAATTEGVRLIASRGATARVLVTDEDGAPVAGATVTAKRPPAPGPGGVFRGGGRGVRAEAGEVRVFDGPRQLGTAVTDKDGVAVIAGLGDGEVQLDAEHREFAPARPVTLPLLPNGTIEVSLTVRTPGYADLRVVQLGGEPVPGARYRVTRRGDDAGAAHTGRCDEAGRALVGPLAAGSYVAELVRTVGGTTIGSASFVISGVEGGGIRGSEQPFTVVAGETTSVVVRRPVLTRISGIVHGTDGPVGGCNVQLDVDDPAEPRVTGMGTGRTVTTKADGSYVIEDVEAGRYLLTYGRPEHIVKAEQALVVPPDTPDLVQDLALQTGKIRVQAWDDLTDSPIAGAEVEVRRPQRAGGGEGREVRMMMVTIGSSGGDAGDSTMMTIGAQRVKTGPDGWAEVEGVPAGDYRLHLTHDAHSPVDHDGVTVHEQQTTDVGRLRMTPAGAVRGKVLTSAGATPQVALVHCRPIDGEEGQPTPTMGGSFRIDALAPGRYVLRAQRLSLGGGGPGAFGPEVEIAVVAGETATVELHLPPDR